jgi:hypothetical protein
MSDLTYAGCAARTTRPSELLGFGENRRLSLPLEAIPFELPVHHGLAAATTACRLSVRSTRSAG